MSSLLLSNFHIAAVYLRNNIECDENAQVVSILAEAFQHKISNNEMCEKICSLNVPWGEALKYETGNEALSAEEEYKCGFIYGSMLYLHKLLSEKQYEKAYQIVDILHVFPDVRLNERKSSKAFWKDRVLRYKKKYHDDFFEKIKPNLIIH